MYRPLPSSVINLMPEVGVTALTTNLGYNYSAAEALLEPYERTELEGLWGSNYTVTRNTSRPQRRLRATNAAATVRTRLNAIFATPRVTYSDNFRTNHISDGDVDRNTARTRGNARNPRPPHNTVLKESYLRGLLITDATTGGADGAARADGNHTLRFQSPNPPNGRISLATRNGGGNMVAEDPGLYFVAVRYSLATDANSRRQKAIRAYHLETDDD